MKIKDANDALLIEPLLLEQYLESAETEPQQYIIKFHQLRSQVKDRIFNKKQFDGVKSNSFPFVNKILKGFRRGELTILTGPTGSGKTTFLSQYSLDFAQMGIPTLWCSFELKNEILVEKMVRHLSGGSIQNEFQFEALADRMEQIPLYFQNLFGSTPVDKILDLVNYVVYAFDVAHIVIDNLQFALSGQGSGFQKFEIQDNFISSLRSIATTNNVHITVVIHPKKIDDDEEINVRSLFGTSKGSQEADNIFIIQKADKFKIMDIRKNRYDGETGRVPILFDQSRKGFVQLNKFQLE